MTDRREPLGPTRVLQPLPQTLQLPTRSLSFWQMRQYDQCPYCYGQKYVEHAVPNTTSLTFAIGNAIHRPLEEARKARLAGREPLTVETLTYYASKGFEDTLAGVWRDGTIPDEPPIVKWTKADLEKGEDKARGEAKDKGIAIALEATPIVMDAEKDYELLGIEVPIDFTGVFPFPFQGYADQVLRDPDDWSTSGIITDTKSSAKEGSPDDWNAWQLCIYKMPWWIAGERMDVGINQILKTDPPDIDKLSRMKDPVKRAKALEIAGRWRRVHLWTEPGYHLEPTDDEMDALYRRFVDLATDLSRDYQRGYFRPTPPSFGEHDAPHPTPRFSMFLPDEAIAS